MTEFEFVGKTVDDAIEEGLKTLNLTKEEVDITVLDEGCNKLFNKTKAKIKMAKKKTDGERAVEFLEGLVELINIPATNELVSEEENLVINIISTNSNALIGHRGEILDAIQTLTGAVANIGREEYKRVVVDCENYREKREEVLKRLASKLADKAVATKRKLSLEPMNPYERRIIHSAIAEKEGVKTESEGVEPNRYVVIIPDNYVPSNDRRFDGRRPFNKRGGFNRDRRFNNNREFNGEKREYNGEKREFNGERRDYNKDRNGFNRDRKPFNRDNNRGGFNSRPQQSAPRKPASTFGSFLGNSKDVNKED